MKHLPVEDVRQIVNLLGKVAVLDADISGKRRFLLIGLAKLIDAQKWFWLQARDDRSSAAPMAFMVIHDGWEGEEYVKLVAGLVSPAAEIINEPLRRGADMHRTRRRIDLLSDAQWFSSELARNCFSPANVGEFMGSVYPLGNDTVSSIFFARSPGRPGFSEREVCIAHLVTSEVDWLHREGTNVPAAPRVNSLSTRQRQVLIQLLAGDSVKQIARKLSLSAYTVNDHIKNIYARFGVSGRGELLAQFLSGGPSASGDLSSAPA